jgi:hypothetical protein
MQRKKKVVATLIYCWSLDHERAVWYNPGTNGCRMKKAGKPCRRRIMGAIERPVGERGGSPLDVLSIARWEIEEI